MTGHSIVPGCRSCGSGGLETVLAFGPMALADGLLTRETLGRPEPKYPLTLAFCEGCGLVQILETVPDQALFGEDYPYYSSYSDTLLEHSRQNAEALIAGRGLSEESLVVELASNDGYLLQYFLARGVPVLGIDPAPGPAAAAEEKGVPTLRAFFDLELARRLRARGTRADVVVANNVLAHVSDLNGFVAGIGELLRSEGVAVLEVPYVVDLVDKCEFDTIYHEHHCYFALGPLISLFSRHGLHVNHVEHHSIHGGSLRLFVGKRAEASPAVAGLLSREMAEGVNSLERYREFAQRVEAVRRDLRAMLLGLKAEGKRIAAYGAAAKGATLLGYAGIGTDIIDFVVDRNVHKQGRFMPGVHVPISDPSRLLEEAPDYVLLLAWNFQREIIEQQAAYGRAGGRFIVPIPNLDVV